MDGNRLTGVGRRLVIDYLSDGRTGLTVLGPHDAAPVAVRGEDIHVLGQGIVLVHNPAVGLRALDGKAVRVQFYYNKLALFFETVARLSPAGVELAVPEGISRVEDKGQGPSGGFSATICLSPSSSEIVCGSDERFPLFVPCDIMGRIKEYLSAQPAERCEAIECRIHAPKVIYIDSKKIVFAARKADLPFSDRAEYGLVLRFPTAGPIKERSVRLTCRVDGIFGGSGHDRLCASACFASVREEDGRFLGDRLGAGV